jgi:SAM-dependent methyltransferase
MANSSEQMEAYSEAVKSGLYAKKTGLVGKYDNVRHCWEEEITKHFLYPHLRKLIKRCQASWQRRIRILDLGCGSADGYELLTSIRHRDSNLQDYEVRLLREETLGFYKGIDLNEDLLQQAREIYSENPKLVFEQKDFTNGFYLSDDEKPYDLYFTSYGTCSHHNEDETLVRLLVDIARLTDDYCLVVCDWLGRYSYEWQTLWTNDLSENRNMDYVVSYIYEAEEREIRRDELQHLFLRLMSRQEAEAIVAEASQQAGIDIKPLNFFDRSIFTGRHMDTAEYNPYAQPIRQAINSLHESGSRTDLSSILVNYIPKPGFEAINDYLEYLQVCWNTLVYYSIRLLETYDEKEQDFAADLSPIPETYPLPLREGMKRMRRVVEGVGWMDTGLPRENVIEPQLGYALRHLVTSLQQGKGCAHGLVGIFEIDKTQRD